MEEEVVASGRFSQRLLMTTEHGHLSSSSTSLTWRAHSLCFLFLFRLSDAERKVCEC